MDPSDLGNMLDVGILGRLFVLVGIPRANQEDGAGTFVLAIDPGLLAGKEAFSPAGSITCC